KVFLTENQGKGLRLPGVMQDWLPLHNREARRWLSLPGAEREKSFLTRLEGATYHMALVVEGMPIRIDYTLGPDLRQSCFILLILFGSQLLYFIGRIGTNNQVIRQTLKPLAEMAATAKSIHRHMCGAEPTSAGIKRLAGAISTLNAHQLNQGLSIDTSHEEL